MKNVQSQTKTKNKIISDEYFVSSEDSVSSTILPQIVIIFPSKSIYIHRGN